jgi:hypothetical protein
VWRLRRYGAIAGGIGGGSEEENWIGRGGWFGGNGRNKKK